MKHKCSNLKYLLRVYVLLMMERKLIGLTWKIDTRIELHPITAEDYRKVSNLFVKEVRDTGIKVA